MYASGAPERDLGWESLAYACVTGLFSELLCFLQALHFTFVLLHLPFSFLSDTLGSSRISPPFSVL